MAKGAAIRHLIPYALLLLQKHATRARKDQLMEAICQLLLEFYQIVNTELMFLSEYARERLPIIGNRFCRFYSELAVFFNHKRLKLFNMTPKLHLFCHLAGNQIRK